MGALLLSNSIAFKSVDFSTLIGCGLLTITGLVSKLMSLLPNPMANNTTPTIHAAIPNQALTPRLLCFVCGFASNRLDNLSHAPGDGVSVLSSKFSLMYFSNLFGSITWSI